MSLFRISGEELKEVETTRFADDGVRERQDLQRLLRGAIDAIAPGVMVLAEEYSDWEDSKRRIDLLCLDQHAHLVVIELKRGEKGGHMELQALRYAAMVSQMTFERAVSAHARFLQQIGEDGDAQERILEFLEWDQPYEDEFAQDVRIVLAAADFSTEITSTALWLLERDIDIRCVKMQPHNLDGETLIHIEQIIPVKSAEDYHVRHKEKSSRERRARSGDREFTGYWFVNLGERDNNPRSWEISRELGFLSAGGGPRWVRQISRLSPGDLVLAYVSGRGYVGVGEVTSAAVRRDQFIPEGESRSISQILEVEHGHAIWQRDQDARDEKAERCVGVSWLETVDRDGAVKGQAQRASVCQLFDHAAVGEVLEAFGLEYEDPAETSS